MPLATTSGVAPKMERIERHDGEADGHQQQRERPSQEKGLARRGLRRPHLAGAGGAGDEREVAHREAHEEDL